jgi:hypothetical protein
MMLFSREPQRPPHPDHGPKGQWRVAAVQLVLKVARDPTAPEGS